MKAYRVELLITDFDKVGSEEIKTILENARYPNRCIDPQVQKIDEADIGEWSDDHPLNFDNEAALAYYKRIFSGGSK